MQSLTGHEPHLELGDTGDWVLELQVRLYLLGYLQQWPAGAYDMATESAVRDVQSARGLDNTGETEFSTWEAVLHLEQQAAIDYYWLSPHDALAQILQDLQNPVVAVGTISEDGHYRWDGAAWVAHSRAAAEQAGDVVSEDGRYRWDGAAWHALEQPPVQAGTAQGSAQGSAQVSADGRWRWDGVRWVEHSADQSVDQSADQSADHTGMVSDDGYWRWDGSAWQVA